MKNNLKAQGYGRHTPAEIEEITKKDLNTLSTILGNKKYLFGENPSIVSF
jgi:hypothetical protein